MKPDWIAIDYQGEICTSNDGAAELIVPEWGVQYIAQRDDPSRPESCGWVVVPCADHYLYTGIQWNWWMGLDPTGKKTYEQNRRRFYREELIDRPVPLIVDGLYIADAAFRDMRKTFMDTATQLLGPKSARRKNEPGLS
jgi:hypothetical protein